MKMNRMPVHQVERLLARLRPTPARDPQSATQGRAAFLTQAQAWTQTVSPVSALRPNGCTTLKKERSPMFKLAVVITSLVAALGGGGGLLAAAEGSLPQQPLYAIKLVGEQVRLRLTQDPAAAWQLAWQLADRRAQELAELAQAGEQPSSEAQMRYQEQVEAALRLGEALPTGEAEQVRLQERERLEAQYTLLGDQPALMRMRQMVQQQLGQPEQPAPSATPPQQLSQKRAPTVPVTTTTITGVGLQGSPTAGQGGNPWVTCTSTPMSGYGPGPGPEATCTGTPQARTPEPTCTPQPHTPEPKTQPTQAGPQPTNAPQQGGDPTRAAPENGASRGEDSSGQDGSGDSRGSVGGGKGH